MSTKNPTPKGGAAELLPIEQLRDKHKIGRAAFAGMCAANGWKPGKVMSETGFLAAATEFMNAPMSGATVQEKEGQR